MSRNHVRKKEIDLAIKHLAKSLEVNSEHIDGHMLMGLALIVKAKCEGMKKDILETAKEHFEICVNNGNNDQQIFSKERLNFIDNAISE